MPCPLTTGQRSAAYLMLTRSLAEAIDNSRAGFVNVSTIRRALAKAEAHARKQLAHQVPLAPRC